LANSGGLEAQPIRGFEPFNDIVVIVVGVTVVLAFEWHSFDQQANVAVHFSCWKFDAKRQIRRKKLNKLAIRRLAHANENSTTELDSNASSALNRTDSDTSSTPQDVNRTVLTSAIQRKKLVFDQRPVVTHKLNPARSLDGTFVQLA
jgi:hypothetical protein